MEEYCQKMKREFFGSEEHPLVQEILGDGYEEEKDWDEEEYEDEEEEEELDNKDDLDVMKDEEI